MKIKMIHRVCALFCALLLSGLDASAALNAYLVATDIRGDSTRSSWQGYVEIVGYNHEVSSPFDPQTGLATGKRQHKPFKILKELSASSVDFETAMIRGRSLANVEFKLVRPSQTGQETIYYIYRFTNARIVSVRDWMANNNDSSTLQLPQMQEISFVYETIEWEAVPSGATASDTWAVPR